MKITGLVAILGTMWLSSLALANERVDPGHPPETEGSDPAPDPQPQFQDPEQQAQFLQQQADTKARQIGNSWQSEGSNDLPGPSDE